MEQENRPKIKKLIKCYKGKLSQNQSQIRNTRKVIIRQNIDKHECNNKIFVFLFLLIIRWYQVYLNVFYQS